MRRFRTLTHGVKCDSMKKRARIIRHERGLWGHIPAAHPTKKVTRGRLKTSHTLPKNHRKFTLKELIARAIIPNKN